MAIGGGGLDHARADEREVERGGGDAAGIEFGRYAAQPLIESGFGGLVGRPMRRGDEEDIERGDADDLPALLFELRDEREEQLHVSEVVELDGAGEIVEAVERVEDGAADRFAGIGDDDVDAVGAQLFDQRRNLLALTEIAGQANRLAAECFHLLAHGFQLVGGARHEDQPCARARQSIAELLADAVARPRDEDGFARYLSA